MTRVRERLFTPSPDMVYWHRLYLMKRVEGGLYMTTFICTGTCSRPPRKSLRCFFQTG